MKKLWLLAIPVVVGVAVFVVLFFWKGKTDVVINDFLLEAKYYGKSDVVEIDLGRLKDLVDSRESFVVFVYQPNCVTSANFEQVLNDFQKRNKVSFYKISFSKVKEYFDFLNYYPSFVIYNKGQVVDFLETDKDEDTERYQSVDAFSDWFFDYVKIEKKYVVDDYEENDGSDEELVDLENGNQFVLDGVVREKGKVNIYFFWGDGCPHCEEETKFFDSIKKEYGKYFNLYKYEVWYNEANAQMLKVFAAAMGDKVEGIPYTIIGEQSFKGFDSSSKEKFLSAIKKEYKSGFDVYFDKLKK